MKVARNLAGLMLILVLMLGCAVGSGQRVDVLKTIEEMTPQQRSTWMQNVWSDEHDSYETMVARPNLTRDQKLILNYKYDMLTKSRPLIRAYRTYVDAGAKPTPEVEREIVHLLDGLMMAVVPLLEDD